MQLTAITSSFSCRNRVTQILRVMKLTAILLTIACLHVGAKGLSQTITLSVKDAPLQEVLIEIKKQSGYSFLYNDRVMQNAKRISLRVNNVSIQDVLDLCFKEQPLHYVIESKTIVITEKIESSTNSDQTAKIRISIDISGKVTTKEGLLLAGASVIIKRTGRGTQTDYNGLFQISNVEATDDLIISFTGYKQKVVKAEAGKRLTIILEIAVDELDQVVLQAYGKTTRRFATGNIIKVSADEIEKQPVMNPLLALQGRVPGMTVTQNNGYASAPIKVSIRGTNIIPLPGLTSATDPLYIVDGVPFTIGGNGNGSRGASVILNGPTAAGGQSPLFSIDPATIESITVLKDADATAIYGSRGANGVILINTKRGKAGATMVSASISQGFTKVSNKRWQMLNTKEYLQIRKEAFYNDSIDIGLNLDENNGPDLLLWDQNRYTNWQGYIFDNGTGHTTDARVDVSWGNQQTKVLIGAGYGRSTDVLTVSGVNQRGSIQFALDQQFSTKLRASFSLNSSFSKSNLTETNSGASLLPPNAPSVFDSAGKLNWTGWEPKTDILPFGNLLKPFSSKTTNFISNLQVNYQLIRGLDLRTSFGYTYTQPDQVALIPASAVNPAFNPTSSSIFGFNTIKNWIIEPQAEYTTLIAKGKLNILIGASLQENTSHGYSIYATQFASDALLQSLSSAGETDIDGESYTRYRYAALFGRINYNWAGKYILNLNARRDGSSKFGLDSRFGNFGSVGMAWIFTEENLFKNYFKYLSFGKIRGSYGITGSDGIGDYEYLSRWNGDGLYQFNNGTPTPLLGPENLVNPNYHWQTNKKLEAAIDLGFWNDRILASFAYYRNRCNNQLIYEPLAYTAGIPSVVNNSPASVQNSGYEIQFSAKIIDGKSFKWGITFNTGKNKNKLLEFPNLESSIYANKYIIGKPLTLKRVLHYTGVNPQTGLYTFEDRNKDGNISTSLGKNDDRYIIDFDPKFIGGVGIDISWKDLHLNAFFNIVNQKGVNAFNSLAPPGFMFNLPKEVLGNYWQKPGDIKEFAKLTTVATDDSYSYYFDSDAAFTDASFIRLQNASLTYNLPNQVSNKIGLKSCRLYVYAQNLFVFTKYKGVDPETQNFGGMPPLKTITGGIQITL